MAKYEVAMKAELDRISVVEEENFSMTVEHFYDSAVPVEYWITTITPKDGNALKTLLKKDFAYTSNGEFDALAKESPYNHADRAKGIFAINASGWDSGVTNKIDGIQIKDGVIVQDTPNFNTSWYTLGVDDNGLLNVFPNTATGSSLLNQGIVNTWSFSIPIIQNNIEVNSSIYSLYSAYNQLYARQVIGQIKDTNQIVVLTADKSTRSQGMTLPQIASILLSRNCRIAYNLDGGGSAQTIYKGRTLNNPSDGTVRPTPDLLYVTKYEQYDKYIGVQKQVVDAIGSFEDFRDKINEVQRTKLTSDDGTIEYTNNLPIDYDQIKGTKYFRHYADLASSVNDSHAPFTGAVDVYGINMQSSYTSACQFVLDRQTNRIAYRFNNLGTWGSWVTVRDTVSYSNATLSNSWVNLGGTDPVAQYCLKDGIVYVKGVVKGGTVSNPMFTLPVGMRPKARFVKGVVLNDGSVSMGRVYVEPNGNVVSLNTASGWMYLEMSFPAEQ